MTIADDFFLALPKHFETAVGTAMFLINNLAVEHGFMNRGQGTVVDIPYADGDHPNHDCLVNRQPAAAIVDFPGNTGQPFSHELSGRNWVPILPRTVEIGDSRGASRTQFPLCLAWALTPWKAQGMTLAKVSVKLSAACAKPGVLFIALTRLRHPDNLLLEDDFPAFSVIRKQVNNPSFAARRRWERRMRVCDSETERRHMRGNLVQL